jgi:hypothetical protein
VADIAQISSSEYAIDGNLSRFAWMPGLEGLRVADASVMPDVIRANTNATTIMIAERVADFMRYKA